MRNFQHGNRKRIFDIIFDTDTHISQFKAKDYPKFTAHDVSSMRNSFTETKNNKWKCKFYTLYIQGKQQSSRQRYNVNESHNKF